MATRFIDSCLLDSDPSRLYPGASGSYTAGKGAFGVPGLTPNNICTTPPFLDHPSTIFVSFYFAPTVIGTDVPLFGGYDSSLDTNQIGVRINSIGVPYLARGGNGSIGGATNLGLIPLSLLLGVTNQWEVKIVISDTVGLFEIRLNGNATPIFSFSGDTKQTVNAFIDAIRFYNGGYFSHIHVFDTANPTGSDPHDYLGNKRLLTLDVDTDGTLGPNDGTTTPAQSAGSHHLNLDEFPPNDDTDYAALTVGQKETLGFQALPGNTSGIVQLSLFPRWRVDDAQAHTVRVNCLSASSTTNGPTKNPPSAYQTDQGNNFPLNPNGAIAWTAAAINAMEGQIEVQT